MLFEICSLSRQTTTCQIGRRSNQDARAAGQFARDQLAVRQRGRDAKSQVETAPHHVDQLIIGRQVQRDLRVALQERRQPLGQLLAGDHLRHADAYGATGLRLPGARAVVRFLQAIEQHAGLPVIVAPGFGQRQPPTVAIEQANLQVIFQLPQLP